MSPVRDSENGDPQIPEPLVRTPDTYLIIAAVALAVYLLSFFLAPGQFEMTSVASDGREVRLIDPDSFRHTGEASGLPLFATGGAPGLFNAVYEGLASGSRLGGAVGVMAFILITGGAFGIVMATGSIDRALHALVGAGSGDGRLLLASLFLAFSLGGAVFGMGEEVIPFVLMVVPVMARLGYDNVTALLVTYVATQIGFATSWMNPFNVAIAQGIAQLPLLSGMPFRIGMWLLFTVAGVLYTLRYAARTRTVPAVTAVPEPSDTNRRLSTGDRLVLLSLAAVIGWIIWGVVAAGYYLPEIATQFMVLGLAAGLTGVLFRLDGMRGNDAAQAFKDGAAHLLPAALVVGLAHGIVFLMGGDDPASPSMLNTLLHRGAESLGDLPAWLAAWSMYLGQSVFNFFVTSGSGQAALTMPLMAPLSDLLGINRQVAVLAFQLGDGLTNIMVPTSAALMGCLGAARLEWVAWIRAGSALFLWLFALASACVVAAVFLGFS